MKRFHLFQLITGLVFFGTYIYAFPNTIKSLEGDDLFLFTDEYISNILSQQQGVAHLITNFLEQFFASSWLGALICTLLMLLAAELFYLSLHKKGKDSLSFLAVLPASIIVYLRFPDMISVVYLGFFTLELFIFVSLKNRITRCLYALCIPVFAYMTMPWSIAIIMFLGFAAIELFINKQKVTSVFMLITIAEISCIPSLWSDLINFVPFEARPFNISKDASTRGILFMYAMMIVAFFVPFHVKKGKIISFVTVIVVALAYATAMITHNLRSFMERMQKVSIMADNKDWEGLLAEITVDDYKKNKLYRAYAMLADNALGLLPQKLMNYPINDPENFLFRHEANIVPTNFNRQFYENIGIWNEAFHQAFEYGVNSRENECFKALRFKTDYALNAHDFGTAKKYISLLQRSCANGKWLKQRIDKLNRLTGQKSPELPYRSDTYVGTYPIPSEMFRLFERDIENKKLLDYVLCSLLLQKQVEKFGIILGGFNLYKDEPLPRMYAEALAILSSRDTSARRLGNYDHALEAQYMACVDKARRNEDCSEFAGTYWAYLLFCDLPKQQTDSNNKSDNKQ